MKNSYRLTLLLCLLLVTASARSQQVTRWKIADLLQYAETGDSALVINFWATWCAPCIEELPYFHAITNRFAAQKVKLVMVSVDFSDMFPRRIAEVASRRGFYATQFWLDEEKPDDFCPKVDPSWSGAIPSTWFVLPATGYRKFREGQLKPAELEAEINHMLQQRKR